MGRTAGTAATGLTVLMGRTGRRDSLAGREGLRGRTAILVGMPTNLRSSKDSLVIVRHGSSRCTASRVSRDGMVRTVFKDQGESRVRRATKATLARYRIMNGKARNYALSNSPVNGESLSTSKVRGGLMVLAGLDTECRSILGAELTIPLRLLLQQYRTLIFLAVGTERTVMADVTIYRDPAAVNVIVVDGVPPVDQSALVASLQAAIAGVRARAQARKDADAAKVDGQDDLDALAGL